MTCILHSGKNAGLVLGGEESACVWIGLLDVCGMRTEDKRGQVLEIEVCPFPRPVHVVREGK